MKHFSPYLYGYHFQILTDHAALRYLFKYKTTIPRVTRWALLLSEFDYDIKYIPGKNNIVPDALSRAVAAIKMQRATQSDIDPASLFNPDKVRKEQLHEQSLREIIEVIEGTGSHQLDPHIIEQYTLSDGCLYLVETNGKSGTDNFEVNLRLVVPQRLKRNALLIAYDFTLEGHYGFKKTLHRATTMFFWPCRSNKRC